MIVPWAWQSLEVLKDLVEQLEGWVDPMVFVVQLRSPGPVAGESIQLFSFVLLAVNAAGVHWDVG